uniref:C-type lectin domain-containing protein n=1 Tax=Pundamilia nyererei TaxID=303518 RepID=A0A3B4H0J8_9CICH
MDQIFTFILLLLSLSGTFSKYVYIDQKMDWRQAQIYCQQHYTDLAPVSNERDNNELQQLASNVNEIIWIGLVRNSSDRTEWLWSGGGAPTMYFWAKTEPNDYDHREDYGFLWKSKWYDGGLWYRITFFCYSASVVTEKKTWEEALEYCREHNDDLASVASETEMLLIQKELSKQNTTEHVWIGLRFLSGDWLLMDGQEMDYEAWGEEGKPSCPHAKMRCGALQVAVGRKGTWKAHDCEERLNFILTTESWCRLWRPEESKDWGETVSR